MSPRIRYFPIWTEKTEPAKRLSGRIESVLDYATTKGYREGENPVGSRGHLDNVLPKPGKVHRVEHQRALPYADAPALAAKLTGVDTPAGRALLLTLLCATRTSETLEATWSEIGLDRREWPILASRMKAGKEHRISLCDAAIVLFKTQSVHRAERGDWGFPRPKARPMFEQYGHDERAQAHGLALAHQLTDKVQAAYFRADLMEQRKCMMSDWAAFLGCESVVA